MTVSTRPIHVSPPDALPAMPPWRLDPMTLHDMDAVLALEQGAYAHPWTRGNFIDSLAAEHWAQVLRPASALQPRHQVQARPLGYVIAMPGVEEFHLLNVTVAADQRRQGLATCMMAALQHHAATHHAKTLWLEVRLGNTEAQALYKRLGFVQQGMRRHYYPAARGQREDAVVMSLRIEGPAEGVDHAA
jgi:[ribosomal protein S18]-alanine N-acetyltransferase